MSGVIISNMSQQLVYRLIVSIVDARSLETWAGQGVDTYRGRTYLQEVPPGAWQGSPFPSTFRTYFVSRARCSSKAPPRRAMQKRWCLSLSECCVIAEPPCR